MGARPLPFAAISRTRFDENGSWCLQMQHARFPERGYITFYAIEGRFCYLMFGRPMFCP